MPQAPNLHFSDAVVNTQFEDATCVPQKLHWKSNNNGTKNCLCKTGLYWEWTFLLLFFFNCSLRLLMKGFDVHVLHLIVKTLSGKKYKLRMIWYDRMVLWEMQKCYCVLRSIAYYYNKVHVCSKSSSEKLLGRNKSQTSINGMLKVSLILFALFPKFHYVVSFMLYTLFPGNVSAFTCKQKIDSFL